MKDTRQIRREGVRTWVSGHACALQEIRRERPETCLLFDYDPRYSLTVLCVGIVFILAFSLQSGQWPVPGGTELYRSGCSVIVE